MLRWLFPESENEPKKQEIKNVLINRASDYKTVFGPIEMGVRVERELFYDSVSPRPPTAASTPAGASPSNHPPTTAGAPVAGFYEIPLIDHGNTPIGWVIVPTNEDAAVLGAILGRVTGIRWEAVRGK